MLKILNENFNILLTIPYHTSVVWAKRFTEGGSFALSLPLDFETDVDLIDKLICHNDNYGIIKYINITSTSIEIKGYDLKGILAFRQAEKKSYIGNVETVIKNIVSDNTTGKRAFPNFVVSNDQARGESITYEIDKYDSVENILKDICTQYNMGYEVTVESGKANFDIIIPQTVDITYSERKKNITDYQYSYDTLDGATVITNYGNADGVNIQTTDSGHNCVVKISGKVCFPNGQIEDVDATTSISTDLNSIQYFYFHIVDNGKADIVSSGTTISTNGCVLVGMWRRKENTYITGSVTSFPTSNTYLSYIGESEPTGYKRNEYVTEISENTDTIKTEINKKLFEDNSTENITASLLSMEDYKKVWNLGDYINVKVYVMGQALTLSKQVSEIEEIYEPNNIRVNPTFGTQKDNIIRKLIKGRMN